MRLKLNAIKILRNTTLVLWIGLGVLQVSLVWPTFMACRHAFDGESVLTFWGTVVLCRGESMDITVSAFQLLNGIMLVLFFMLIFWQILLKKKALCMSSKDKKI